MNGPGRPAIADKKVPFSASIRKSVADAFDERVRASGMSRGDYLESLITDDRAWPPRCIP